MSIRITRIFGVVILSALAIGAKIPDITISSQEIASRFSFSSVVLDEDFGIVKRHTRNVHPDLEHIRPWISSVGAAAAIGDIDGNLKSDDSCRVDTRINQVIVTQLTRPANYSSFRLVAPNDGFNSESVAPMGCLIGDLNEDGLPDMLVYYWGRPPVAFLRRAQPRNDNQNQFNISADSYLATAIASGERWFTNAATFADVDGDGHADLLIGNYFCDGGRILEEATKEPVCPHPVMQDSMSRAFNGGKNRILLWKSAKSGGQPTVEFEDASSTLPPHIANAWTLAIGAQDLNGDLLPELYFANDFGPDRLLANCSAYGEPTRKKLGCHPLSGRVSFRLIEGGRTFTKPASKVLGQDSFKGMGVDFADINGDGIPDIYVSNITDIWALQESQFVFLSDGRKLDQALLARGIAPYSEESESLGLARSGWAWDSKFADFDNDGVMEALQAVGFVRGRNADVPWYNFWRKSCWSVLHELATSNDELLKFPTTWFRMGHDASGVGCDLSGSNRNPFFVRKTSGRFVNVSQQLSHIDSGERAVSRGIAIGDVNQDGLLDYIEAKQFGASSFHLNTSSDGRNKNSFIGLTVRFANTNADSITSGIVANSRPAFGATVIIELENGEKYVGQVDGGNGHSGCRWSDSSTICV